MSRSPNASARAYIGLGSNLGDRLENLARALTCLTARGVRIPATSSVYQTDPVGPSQPDFLNAVAAIDTELGPEQLLILLKSVEVECGRTPGERWGPRVIDLDLLMYDDLMIDRDGLRVPHPQLTNRAFVMVPMLELDPDLELPSGEPLSAFCEPDPPGVARFAPPEALAS
jgi:2-amino-4-hydroxy-6-hydroxymethyldihydropteridine diphosphokinase